jgi:hypothetical protein
MTLFHRTRGGFYLTLWGWQVHITLRKLGREPAKKKATP